MRVGSCFSGIGGLDLGLEWAGMKVEWQIEIDEYCGKILAKHWPNVPRFKDIRQVNPTNLSPVDLVVGGYPCQPFSIAGKRKGAADDRHLWPEMFRLIEGLKPAWILCENVAGHIKMGLDSVLSDLESIGYTTQPFVIPACAVDAPHRRDRVWIVAHHNGQRELQQSWSKQEQWERIGYYGENVSNSSPQGLPQSEQQAILRKGGGQKRGTVAEFCRWSFEPILDRVAYGLPNRVDRLSGLGNAVVPQVAYEIGRAIMAADSDLSGVDAPGV